MLSSVQYGLRPKPCKGVEERKKIMKIILVMSVTSRQIAILKIIKCFFLPTLCDLPLDTALFLVSKENVYEKF